MQVGKIILDLRVASRPDISFSKFKSQSLQAVGSQDLRNLLPSIECEKDKEAAAAPAPATATATATATASVSVADAAAAATHAPP